jgi:hypothetical protein
VKKLQFSKVFFSSSGELQRNTEANCKSEESPAPANLGAPCVVRHRLVGEKLKAKVPLALLSIVQVWLLQDIVPGAIAAFVELDEYTNMYPDQLPLMASLAGGA